MKKILGLWLALWGTVLGVLASEPLLLDWGLVLTSSAEQQAQSRGLRTASMSAVQRKSAAGTVPWLVQFNGVIREEWKTALTEAGAVLQGYMPENAFLVEATPGAIAKIGAMKKVYWIGEYLPEYKRSGPIREALAKGMIGTKEVNVLVFNPSDAKRIGTAIAALPGCSVTVAAPMTDRGLVRAALTAAAVEEVTSWGEVEWVEPYLKPRLWNDVAVRTNKMNVTNVWNALGLTGDGQTIAVCDTGLDSGNASAIHPDFSNRVVWAQALGRPGNWSDPNSHGTHVSGSVLGSGAMSTGQYRGVAYEAHLVFQSVLDAGGGLGGLPDDLNVLFRAAYTNDARIHSDSWGAPYAGEYTTDSRYLDMFVWSNKNMLVLFSAGNDGIDANSDGVIDLGSVGSPATAKNCLTIGAAETYRTIGGYSTDTWGTAWPVDYPKNPIKSDYISRPDSPQGMAAFSSRGPCLDGRIKPDLVAPGTDIISARSRAASGAGWGTVSGNTNYLYMGGTSMATPLTAGAAGLVRQWLVTSAGITNPSAAMMKGLMINGARNMAPGQYGTNATQEIPFSRPNNVQGWGHVNLYNTLQPATNQFLDLYDTNSLATGSTNTFKLTVNSATTNKFIVTMAYSDYWAASGAGKKLVNDLDLTIRKPSGAILYANGRSSVDATNNVEMIEFAPNEVGDYTARVAGRTVPLGDSQAYALIVRGYDTGEPVTNVYFIGSTASVNNASGAYTVTVCKSQSTGNIAGQLALSGDAIGGGVNYTFASDTNFTLNGAVTSASFVVTLVADAEIGGSKNLIMNLANVTGAGIGEPSRFTLNIRGTSVSFIGSTASVNKASGDYTVTVCKSQSTGNIAGQLAISGDAIGGGVDYTFASDTNFTLNGAVTSASFVVTLVADAEIEGSKNLVMTLANVTGAGIGDPSRFTLNIRGTRMDFIRIPAGEFKMGNTFGDGWSDELPAHSVNVSAFLMDTHEVTKELWDEVYEWATNNGYGFDNPGLGKAAEHPVYGVNWYDAIKWCNARSEMEGLVPCYGVEEPERVCLYRVLGPSNSTITAIERNGWMNWSNEVTSGECLVEKATTLYPADNWRSQVCVQVTGEVSAAQVFNPILPYAVVYRTGQSAPFCAWTANGYRLPTEAEWEKAARGGTLGTRFPWSDANTIQHARANYYAAPSTFSYDTSPTPGYHPDYMAGGTPYTSPVGSFAPNDYGLYDMAGNVWEFCWDWYWDRYYALSPTNDPRGPDWGSARVLRGGGWSYFACYSRISARGAFAPPDYFFFNLGFRPVRSASQ